MGKSFGIVLMLLAVWIAAELYIKGMDQAFGGAFAGSETAEERVPVQSVPKRAGAAVERAQQEHEARYDALIPE